ncbi:MAG: GTP-binding protein [Thermodesulfobacteriota bacterium]
MDKQVPVTIISGFLGAGKTTLLNHILNTENERKIAVLVNDFGEINIDAELIVNIENEVDNTVNLTNGCICCSLSEDLLESILNILERPDLDHIIIEASGVSDPAAIALNLLLPGIRELIKIENIISIIDAENVLELTKGRYSELGIAQISVADILILNKVDLIDKARADQIIKSLKEILPNSRIVEASHGVVPLELVFGLGVYNPDRILEAEPVNTHVHSENSSDHNHEHSHHGDVFSTWSYTTDKILSYDSLRTALKSLPTNIFRAKGIVYQDKETEKRGIVHMVGRRCTLSWGNPWAEQQPYSKIVMIGTPEEVDQKQIKDHFDKHLISE